MVSTRRRVVNEQDRFGGYGNQPTTVYNAIETEVDNSEIVMDSVTQTPLKRRMESRSALRSGANPIVADIYSEQTRGYTETTRSHPEQTRGYTETTRSYPEQQRPYPDLIKDYPEVEYSGRREYSELVAPSRVSAPRRVQKTGRREREDLMPSIKTRAYDNAETDAAAKKKEMPKAKTSSKTKALLAVYMAVVVVLAVLVIATGIAVNGLTGEVSALEREILTKNQMLTGQNAEILKLTDDSYIAGEALKDGMEKVDSVTGVTLVPVSQTIKYESRTNWFDKFCDWLSNIIGG